MGSNGGGVQVTGSSTHFKIYKRGSSRKGDAWKRAGWNEATIFCSTEGKRVIK